MKTGKKTASECWGIFKRKNDGFSGTHRTPIVYCDTKETAERVMNDVTFVHYSSKYYTKDFCIKKITKYQQ